MGWRVWWGGRGGVGCWGVWLTNKCVYKIGLMKSRLGIHSHADEPPWRRRNNDELGVGCSSSVNLESDF